MYKKTGKVLSIILALIMIFGVFSAASLTVYADDNPYHDMGYCGNPTDESIEWYLFKDGSVAFFGTGNMDDYGAPAAGSPASPWYLTSQLMAALTGNKISIEDGITSVGDYAFYLPTMYSYFTQTSNIDLPNSLTKIGVSAFENMPKIQKIAIPENVIFIGDNAFKGCTTLRTIDLYANPSSLTWDASYFTQTVTVHILPEYESQISDLNTSFNSENLVFEANLHTDLGLNDDGVTRNIKGYTGVENSAIFGGASPYIVVGTFSGEKKSVTHGNNGFVSCVYYNNKYYLQESNQSGKLKEAVINGTSGVVTGMKGDFLAELNLTITSEYIGANVVKMVFNLKNNTDTPISGIKLGATGDIKIGADDYADIKPLMETVGESEDQTGFYMQSGQEYDKNDAGEYATLGFVGKNVEGSADDATFFFGEADANKSDSATGAYRLRMMPERIFIPGTGASSEKLDDVDSGMSFYWDNIDLNANETKTYAVLFSVYGASSDKADDTLIEDKDASNFYNVYWNNYDDTTLVTQVVKRGETPIYPGETPTRPRDNENNSYTFSGWSPEITAVTGEATYTAQYTSTHYRLFRGHSLTLKGDIGVNFFVDVDAAQVASGVTIKFDWPGEVNTHSEYTLSASDYDSATGFYKAQCKVCAAEMTDNIHATAYFGTTLYEEEDDNYSVRRYADEIITPAEGGPIAELQTSNLPKYTRLLNLVYAMLNYGTKAQIVFNHNNTETNLANYNVDSGDTLSGTVTQSSFDAAIAAESENGGLSTSDMTDGVSAFGLKYYATSVVFLSETSLRHYYTISNQELYAALKTSGNFNYTLHEEKLPHLYFEIKDIHAKDLDKLQTFTIGDQTYCYSILDFAKELLDESRTEALNNLGIATYWYSHYANNYFDNL